MLVDVDVTVPASSAAVLNYLVETESTKAGVVTFQSVSLDFQCLARGASRNETVR
jgi:hypothetical protein